MAPKEEDMRSNLSICLPPCWFGFGFMHIASPQQGDLGLSRPPSGQSAGGGARTRDKRVLALHAGCSSDTTEWNNNVNSSVLAFSDPVLKTTTTTTTTKNLNNGMQKKP
ncbi:hypothetical protein PoB_005612400 [Plakobranchus ocellatus]|uniref:Uncharacterized protein n=1 Tax=Plakobranchus ocellatus TaxID=259542 RepID=A0AAV4CEP7_9GAST|nr:hypothetical protein PoB_005612400 [Plakobranchus ocellatus]